jgi:hypothetical protein
MLKSLRTPFALLVIAAALAAPAYAQQSPKPNESPRAMRPPNPAPQAAATLSAKEEAARKEAEKGTPEQQAFARRVVNAMSNKDFGAITQAIAPSTLKCIGKHDDFLQDRIRKLFALPINTTYESTFSKLPDNAMHSTKYSTYTMPPTHLMELRFDTPDSKATVNLPIGQEAGKWYQVEPCPTDLGLQRFDRMQKMQAQRREQAKAAMVAVKDPVKSQLLALIGKRDNVGAWRKCMSDLHFDFPTCRGIVAILGGDEAD